MSELAFFSDRTGQPVPRVGEEVTADAWRGLVALIERALSNGWLACDFPLRACHDDSSLISGTDDGAFIDSLKAHVPLVGDWPPPAARVPSTPAVLDTLEFVARHLRAPLTRPCGEK
jgi:hypothetical protein